MECMQFSLIAYVDHDLSSIVSSMGRSNDGRRYHFLDQDKELIDNNNEDDSDDAKVIVNMKLSILSISQWYYY